MASNARFICGALTVNVGSHQWGFQDGYVYLERTLGETPYYILHRRLYGISFRYRQARFVKRQTTMEAFRNLGIHAALTATPVTFIPDIANLGDTWTVDWPMGQSTRWVIENRDEMIIRLIQQSPGA
jgi:hypothetical protein